MVVIRQHTVAEFRSYLEQAKRTGAVLRASFLHHTYSPDASGYRGLATIEAIRNYHVHQRGFTDIACHAYAAPDGTVFNGRPPSSNNCACQAPDKPASAWPAALRTLSGGVPGWMNRYGFSVETIGNFDAEDPATSAAMRTTLDVLASVHRVWAIPPEHCYFHRDVAHKTCPGSRVTRAWVQEELRRRLTVADKPSRPDVAPWAEADVAWARDQGLMVGRPDGSFGGGDPVTREELAVVLRRLAQRER